MAVTIRDAKCIRQTEKAILVEVEGEQFWIPQSQVEDDSEVYKAGTEGDLVISDWIAEQKGLDDAR
jgi:hypothetical protein